MKAFIILTYAIVAVIEMFYPLGDIVRYNIGIFADIIAWTWTIAVFYIIGMWFYKKFR